MSFRATIDAIMASVSTEVPSVAWSIGSRSEAAHTSPPSVRWAPVADAIGAAPKRSASTDHLTRVIAGVDTTFRVKCWGVDFDQAEQIRDAVLRGCQKSAPAFARGERGTWLDSDAITEGEAVEITVILRGFVPESPAPAVVTVTTVDTTDTEVSSQ